MKTVIKIAIQCAILLMSSCSGSKFINRKYTAGIFRQHQGAIKHNTLFVDTTKLYTAINPKIEFKRLELPINKEIEENNLGIKKDVICPILKKGNDDKYVKRFVSKGIKIYKTDKNKILKIMPKQTICQNINPEEILNQAMSTSKIAIGLSVFPIVGLIATSIAIRKFKMARKLNPSANLKKEKIVNIISLIISILSILAVIAYAIYIVYLIGESFGNAATAAFSLI